VQIILPYEIQLRLMTSLSASGEQEIGGILMGQHIGEATFEVKEITIQPIGGSVASFMRSVKGIILPLKRFFRQTGRKYTEFNYLGEWHSHPSFSPQPSRQDTFTMQEIISNPDVGANFAILMIVKMDPLERIIGTVTAYLSSGQIMSGTLVYGDPKK